MWRTLGWTGVSTRTGSNEGRVSLTQDQWRVLVPSYTGVGRKVVEDCVRRRLHTQLLMSGLTFLLFKEKP